MRARAVGVIGAGPMGRLHARALARRAARVGDVELAGIHDRHPGRAEAVAREFGCRSVADLAALARRADAVVVAVPTPSHVDASEALLDAGLDVLVEKPMAERSDQAQRLVAHAARLGRVLGVGQAEWFNPLLVAAREAAGRPVRIEVDRLNAPSERGRDVDVVQDLMLHDLDWVSRWVGTPILEVAARADATGPDGLDEAEAELRFEGGVSARLRASRIRADRRRLVRVAGTGADVTVDLVTGAFDGGPADPAHAREPLDLLWDDFLEACAARRAPENDGRVAVAALELVERVRAVAAKSLRDGDASDASGDPTARD